jgi:hypothetical protein
MGCAASQDGVAPAASPHNRRIHRVPLPGSWKWPQPVTPDELAARRAQFWDTQTVSGRAVMWQNLRLVADALLLGDIELASSIIAAANMVVPHGDLLAAPALVAYDALGGAYELPRFLWSTPGNVVSADEAERARAARRPPPPRAAVPAEPLALRARLAATPRSAEQDVPLALRNVTTVEELRDALDAALASGKHDVPPDASNKRPNVWAGVGLPAARQRIMFRCGVAAALRGGRGRGRGACVSARAPRG